MVRTVLVADDDRAAREFMTAALSLDGLYRVLSAKDGVEALKTARVEKPDLVVLDILMPGLDGFEVCQALKKNAATRRVKVLLVTALPDVSVRSLAQLGADGFLQKPFSPVALAARVAALLDEK